jgi:DNA-binding transcriptional MerR regulator
MNISDASQASGLSADTIRFYERRCVVPGPARSANGYRDYTERHVEALRFAKGLKDLGLPLSDVAVMIRLAHDGTCGDLRGAILASVDETAQHLDERLRVLRYTKRQLAALRAGLEKMSSKRSTIPGVMPCACVDLVGRTRRRR